MFCLTDSGIHLSVLLSLECMWGGEARILDIHALSGQILKSSGMWDLAILLSLGQESNLCEELLGSLLIRLLLIYNLKSSWFPILLFF